MSAARTVHSPAFTPTWGPSEDGVVVASRSRAQQSRSQIDIVFGFTPWESWAWLDNDIVTKGKIYSRKVIILMM